MLVGCLLHKLCLFLRFDIPAIPPKTKKVNLLCPFLTNRGENFLAVFFINWNNSRGPLLMNSPIAHIFILKLETDKKKL